MQNSTPLSQTPSRVINPDGVPISILWERFTVGSSVFVPAVNTHKLQVQMRLVAKECGMTLQAAERIENGRLGVRFWRVV